MNESKISVRYSKALLELSEDKGVLEEVKSDMEEIYKVASEVEELNELLLNPVVKLNVKSDLISRIFKGQINDLSFRFLMLILQNNRENYIKDIARVFLDMYRKLKGVKRAVLTTAVRIESSIVSEIREILKVEFDAEVELRLETEPNIIGGFVIKLDDLQYDASISNYLRSIKKELLKTGVSQI